MTDIFIKLLNMSLTAGWLILAVVLFRLLFAKAPKAIRVCLWGLVALRLLLPFSWESTLSLVPSAEPIPEEITTMQPPQIHTGLGWFNSAVNPYLDEKFPPIQSTVPPAQLMPPPEANDLSAFVRCISVLWLCGITVMLIYAAVSYLRLRIKLREAVLYDKNVWLCDRIDTPFILGLIRPRIILPSFLDETEYAPVLAHENAHLRRRDHIWKPLGFALLTVYWFHPLIWLAYVLLCRDIELACDEKVVKALDTEQTKAYTRTLLRCSAPRKLLSACPLAFGEVGVSTRVKQALHYKKPAFWLILLALIACIITAVCFLTDPPAQTETSCTPNESSSPETSNNTENSTPEPTTYEIISQTYVNGLVLYADEPALCFQTDNLFYTILTEEELAKLGFDYRFGEYLYPVWDDLAGWGKPSMNECKIDCALYMNGEWYHLSKEKSYLYHGIEIRGVTDEYISVFDAARVRALPLTDDSLIYSDVISYHLDLNDIDTESQTEYVSYILQLQKSVHNFKLYIADGATNAGLYKTTLFMTGTYELTESQLILSGNITTVSHTEPLTFVFDRAGDGFAYCQDRSAVLEQNVLPFLTDRDLLIPHNILYDIDEDGIPETIDFCEGPTSGVISYGVILCERGVPAYDTVVTIYGMSNGVYIDEYGRLASDNVTRRGDLKIIDGKLKLFVHGKETYYLQ